MVCSHCLLLASLVSPPHIFDHKRRALRLKATKYCFAQDGLGWMSPDGVILRCVNKEESENLITEFHAGLCGGHYATKTTAHKILRAGYYWPSIFANTLNFVKKCQPCQLFVEYKISLLCPSKMSLWMHLFKNGVCILLVNSRTTQAMGTNGFYCH